MCMTLGERIKRQRKIKKVSQEELAARIGMKHSVISKYENNQITPSVEQIHKIGAQAHSTGSADVPERTTDPDRRWNPTLDITGYAKGLQLNKEKKDI